MSTAGKVLVSETVTQDLEHGWKKKQNNPSISELLKMFRNDICLRKLSGNGKTK